MSRERELGLQIYLGIAELAFMVGGDANEVWMWKALFAAYGPNKCRITGSIEDRE